MALSTLIALVAANGGLSSLYFEILETPVAGLSLHHWTNDGLMTIFFFVIGMEIKREIVAGELDSLQKAALPVCAAIGGMIAPAVIYFLINPEGHASRGWAIPMATDIAFALGILSLFGPRVPLALKVFLLTLAIVDDLGAVIVIAAVYTNEIKTLGLYVATSGVLCILLARYLGIRSYVFYVFLGVILWLGVFYSGVHSTIAGVILGLLTPHSYAIKRNSPLTFSPINELIHYLHPWVSFGIMPIFALTNAGISLAGGHSVISERSVSNGVFLGLLLGKPVGIMLASTMAVFLGITTLPQGLKWRHIAGVSCLGGIGFTMAIFIATLSLGYEQSVDAKIAILAASFVSALAGGFILNLFLERPIEASPRHK